MLNEVWKPVVGYEGLYEASDQGRVRGLDREIRSGKSGRRIWKGRVLVQEELRHGYMAVSLCKDGERWARAVHAIVLEAFSGLPPARHECAHDNNIRSDNRLSNLSWKTRKENFADKIRHGTQPRGETHWRSGLDAGTVLRARDLGASGAGPSAISRHLGVSRCAVKHILDRTSWRHV